MQYKDPIRVRRGELVRVGREDDEHPGWWWCTSIEAKQGWVPAELIAPSVKSGSTLKMLADYESTELSVQYGDLLDVLERRCNWLFVRNVDDNKVGWVPADIVESA